MVEKNSELEISHYDLYIIVAVFFLFLCLYFIYLTIYYNNVKNEITEVSFNNESSNLGVIINGCDNFTGELKNSCNIKNSVCNDDNCYYFQAKLTKNETNCFNIVDLNKRVMCSASIKHDNIIQNAVIQDDILICQKLEIAQVIISCEDNYYFIKAINTYDKSFCNNISNQGVKNECLF